MVGRDFGEIQIKNASIKAATSLLVPMLVLVRALKGGEVCKLSDNKRGKSPCKDHTNVSFANALVNTANCLNGHPREHRAPVSIGIVHSVRNREVLCGCRSGMFPRTRTGTPLVPWVLV